MKDLTKGIIVFLVGFGFLLLTFYLIFEVWPTEIPWYSLPIVIVTFIMSMVGIIFGGGDILDELT